MSLAQHTHTQDETTECVKRWMKNEIVCVEGGGVGVGGKVLRMINESSHESDVDGLSGADEHVMKNLKMEESN